MEGERGGIKGRGGKIEEREGSLGKGGVGEGEMGVDPTKFERKSTPLDMHKLPQTAIELSCIANKTCSPFKRRCIKLDSGIAFGAPASSRVDVPLVSAG